MKATFTTWLVSAGIILSVFACTDHRQSNPSPARLRLKTVTTGASAKTYSYDSQNRLTTISRSDGSLGLFVYGDPEMKYVDREEDKNFTYYIDYPVASDQTKGEATQLPLGLGNSSFVGRVAPLFGSKFSPDKIQPYRLVSYQIGDDKKLKSVTRVPVQSSNQIATDTYGYTGENITDGRFTQAAGRFITSVTYSYDDKANPFFGLFDPGISETQRYSRNNFTLSTVTVPVISNPATSYTYEYNQQGLPTKVTTKDNSGNDVVTLYTYESY